MDHFEGVTPEQRWKNDMLDEIRRMNANMEKLIQERSNYKPEQLELIPEPKTERKGKANGTKSR